MNANKLMIGDFIRLKESKNIVVVEAIDYDGNVSNNHVIDFFFCEGFCSGEKRYNYAPDCFEPIPLTPEILEKNGFNLTTFDGKIGKYWEIPGFVMGEFGQTSIGQNNIQIEYVHELQHALRICGIDKEITITV